MITIIVNVFIFVFALLGLIGNLLSISIFTDSRTEDKAKRIVQETAQGLAVMNGCVALLIMIAQLLEMFFSG